MASSARRSPTATTPSERCARPWRCATSRDERGGPGLDLQSADAVNTGEAIVDLERARARRGDDRRRRRQHRVAPPVRRAGRTACSSASETYAATRSTIAYAAAPPVWRRARPAPVERLGRARDRPRRRRAHVSERRSSGASASSSCCAALGAGRDEGGRTPDRDRAGGDRQEPARGRVRAAGRRRRAVVHSAAARCRTATAGLRRVRPQVKQVAGSSTATKPRSRATKLRRRRRSRRESPELTRSSRSCSGSTGSPPTARGLFFSARVSSRRRARPADDARLRGRPLGRPEPARPDRAAARDAGRSASCSSRSPGRSCSPHSRAGAAGCPLHGAAARAARRRASPRRSWPSGCLPATRARRRTLAAARGQSAVHRGARGRRRGALERAPRRCRRRPRDRRRPARRAGARRARDPARRRGRRQGLLARRARTSIAPSESSARRSARSRSGG